MDIRTPQGQAITRWEEWTRPKRDYQWKEGRSAMELARAWFQTGQLAVPRELAALFDTTLRLENLVLEHAVPERVTRLPEHGEGRNHDLWLLGRTPREQVTVCIEAKADESFGNHSVGEYLRSALQRRDKGDSTRAPERIDALFRMVDSHSPSLAQSPWANIPYQLLTALCGTALQAAGDESHLAIFVVHVFRTDQTAPEKLAANSAAYSKFVECLIGEPAKSVANGRTYGPAEIAGTPCLVGKIEVSS